MPRATLDALPTELIHIITTHLPTPLTTTLLSLCLTNRALAAATTTSPAFETLFTTRTADLACLDSLATLAAVAAHPALGRLVRTIVLRTTYRSVTALLKHVRSGGGREWVADGRGGVLCRRGEGDEGVWDAADERRARRRLAECVVMNREMREVRESGRDEGAVAGIFAGVAAGLRGVVLEARVLCAYEEEVNFAGEGARMQARKLLTGVKMEEHEYVDGEVPVGDCEKLCMWRDMARDFGVMLKAMAQAQTRVEVLRIYGGEWGGSVVSKEMSEAMDGIPRPALVACLAHVKVLSGAVSCGALGDLGREDNLQGRGNAFADRVGQFLGLARNLEELDLLHHESHEMDLDVSQALFQKMVAPIAGDRIRSLRLGGFKPCAADLLGLLRKLRPLQHLELYEMVIQNGKWTEVFTMLRHKKPELQQLTLYRLCEDYRVIITRPENHELMKSKPNQLIPPLSHVYRMDAQQVQSGIEYKLRTAHIPRTANNSLHRRLSQLYYRF